MKSKKILRNYRDDSIYINESLTPQKSDIFAKARLLRKDILSDWTRDGHVYLKKSAEDKPCLIESINELCPNKANNK